ncbi:MAG: acetolactate synthase [Bacteroidaceae bacterium]|nr:acetolactate synthase [Bacteroidaceae bacterium]
MTIKQISLFLENKYGRLSELLAILSKADVHIVSTTIADTSDYGLMRLITSDQQKAYKVLKDNGVLVSLNEVVAISVEPQAADFARVVELFTKRGINIEYMYCFNFGRRLVLVMRCSDLNAVREVVRNNSLTFVTETDLMKM